MSDLPVILKVKDQRCVVLGGGEVALRRVACLQAAGASITVISPQMHEQLVQNKSLTLITRPYQPGDLAGSKVVVIATSDPAVNAAAAGEAKAGNVLINRADDPADGDLVIPSHAHHGPITLSVHTSGVSAAAAATIRRELSASLRPHWQTLLTAASPWRSRIQEVILNPQERRLRLVALTSPAAITLLQTQGLDALEAYYHKLADPHQPLQGQADHA